MDIVGFMRRIGVSSKTELSKMLNTKPQNINKWFNKEQKEPTYEMCVRLLSIGMSVEELFGLDVAKKVVVFKSIEEKQQAPIEVRLDFKDPAVQQAVSQAVSDALRNAAQSLSDKG